VHELRHRGTFRIGLSIRVLWILPQTGIRPISGQASDTGLFSLAKCTSHDSTACGEATDGQGTTQKRRSDGTPIKD
jgi:hypothetical protein